MSQSNEDIAKALAALAGENVEPTSSPNTPSEVAPEQKPEVEQTAPPAPAQTQNPVAGRPSRPESPASRPVSPTGSSAATRNQPVPQISNPTSIRPERPLKPVKPNTASQIAPAPLPIEFAPPPPPAKSLNASDELRLRSLRSTLALRQLFIPSCMVLGVTLPLLAIVWFVLRTSDSPMVIMKLPVWAVAVVALAGVFFAGLSATFIASTKTLNRQISELDETARTA